MQVDTFFPWNHRKRLFHIGAQLSFIISTVDNMRYGFGEQSPKLDRKLGRLSGFASSTVRDLRDTVWAMNKDAVTVADLRDRIANFIGRARETGARVDFRMEVDEGLEHLPALSAHSGMNVYRVLQEAVANALRYAEASELIVRVASRSDRLLLSVEDNGRGFSEADVDAAQDRGGGTGLGAMRQRTEEVGGEFDLDAQPGKGTRISIDVPLLRSSVSVSPEASPTAVV